MNNGMKILIPLASHSRFLSGVQRHAINLTRALLTRTEVEEITLVTAPLQLDFVREALPAGDPRLRIHAAPIRSSILSRNLWFYTELPKLARQLKADVVHLAYPVPMRRGAFHCSVAVTLHDMYPYEIPENFGFPRVWFNRILLRRCLERADAIACVSQGTLSRLREILPNISAAKTVVIPNSIEPAAPIDYELSVPSWGNQPFLLCVAQHRRNKNILLALRIFERLVQQQHLVPGTRLLIIGIDGPETSAIRNYITSSKLEDSVLLLQGISDDLLQWCYRNCLLLLAPSIVEGFGLPVAEALLAGCRVVSSDLPSLREFAGDRCVFVPLSPNDLENVTRFAIAICDALHQPRPEPIFLPQLSARSIAEQYMQLYRSIIPIRSHNPISAPAPMHDQAEGTPLSRI
jgi:glycosyltransferase involved in cell wall biosynthesis